MSKFPIQSSHKFSIKSSLFSIFLAASFVLCQPTTFAQNENEEGSSKQSAPKNNSEADNKVSKKDKVDSNIKPTAGASIRDLAVPILYLTDRDAEKPSYGSKRKYIIDCQHDMNYGVAKVFIPNDKKKTDKALFERLGWSNDSKAPVNSVACDPVNEPDASKRKEAFFKLLEKTLDASGDNKVCLFVHGADEGFDDAALDAASMAYALEYPVIMYSWPSVPKLFSYTVDGGNNEFSQAHFDMFLKDLLEFRKTHPVEVTLVSHSMGNRLVIRAAHLMQGTGLIKDAEMVSPDIDAETFKHYAMGLENEQATIRLYTSARDKMLPLSQMVYGGYYRLGEGVGAIFSGWKKPDDTDQPTGEAPTLAADQLKSIPSGKALPSDKRGRVERIDFTAIDEGFSGHSIPFDALASMIRTDSPGDGLGLTSSSPGKGSAMARFMRWSHHLGKIDDAGDTDLCKRIVRITSAGSKK